MKLIVTDENGIIKKTEVNNPQNAADLITGSISYPFINVTQEGKNKIISAFLAEDDYYLDGLTYTLVKD